MSRRDSAQFAKKSDNTFRPAGKLGQRWRRSRPGISIRTVSTNPE
jgi:hypothetical protein